MYAGGVRRAPPENEETIGYEDRIGDGGKDEPAVG